MAKFLNADGLSRLVALIKQALGGKQDTLVSGTNIKTVNNNSLLGSGNLSLNDAAIPYDGNGAYALEDATNVQEALDILDDAVNGLDIPPHVVVNEDPTGGSQTIQNPELLNKIESITATESTASGGSNTVTITETNGTTTSFNVKNGTNGGNLGDIDVVDVTGDRTDAVMSQKAVTEYGRKATAEDLNGTSDWIRTKLTEEGWEFGKYLDSNGVSQSNSSYCVSPFIDINDIAGHSLTFSYRFTSSSTRCIVFYNDNNVKVNYWSSNSTNSRTFTPTAAQITNATKVRFTLNPNDLSNCYIYDNTTKEYIYRCRDDISVVAGYNNPVVGYGFLENNIIEQTTGSNPFKVMSQKVVTDKLTEFGRYSYSGFSYFNNMQYTANCHSQRKYDLSSEPIVDAVSYEIFKSAGQRGNFFGFTPNINSGVNNVSSNADYIGFTPNTWNCNFIVRRNGTTLFTQDMGQCAYNYYILACRFDFRRKQVRFIRQHYNGTTYDTTLDLSAYDLDMGECYMISCLGYCGYTGDMYVTWNGSDAITDLSSYVTTPLYVGAFAKFNEYIYPSSDYDGRKVGSGFNDGTLNNLGSVTKIETGHYSGTINSSISPKFSATTTNSYNLSSIDQLVARWKMKPTGSDMTVKQSTYFILRDIYDITDEAFLTPVDSTYTVPDGHTCEIRGQLKTNFFSAGNIAINGTCTVEMWDFEMFGRMNVNITPSNYDGKIVYGGIPFVYNYPDLVRAMPLMSANQFYCQGANYVNGNKIYARLFDSATKTYINKQINNS